MKIHPDILACHAQFGGDLEDMQRRYDARPGTKDTPDPRRAILINRHEYRRQQTAATNHTAEVLHTLCSAMALGLFVVGGFMMIVALA